MLNYELARVITLDRQRDIERAVRQRLLQLAAMDAQAEVQHPLRRPPRAAGVASSLAASRSR